MLVVLGVLGLTGAARADLVVPASGSVALGGGTLDLACTDVIVAGTLDLGGGSLSNVRSVVIQAGGVVSVGGGSISLSGDWSNAGTLNAGTGTVSFVDAVGCATNSTISGNSTFFRLSIVSATGKLYRFASGSMQTTLSQLTLTGAAGNPLRIESTVVGSRADINLIGAQAMANLAVRDMTASGQWLALGQSNQAVGGVAVNWFGFPTVPVNSPLVLWLLFAGLLLGGGCLSRSKARQWRA